METRRRTSQRSELRRANSISDRKCPYPVVAWPYRALFYAMCSFYLEVVWTALYELWETGNVKMRGYSSIWSFFIYGSGLMCVEQLCFALRRRGCSLPVRGFCYMLICFANELLYGIILQPYNANSWDYSKQFKYHYRGLIALEYAPLWFIGSCLFELKIDVCNSVHVKPAPKSEKSNCTAKLSEEEPDRPSMICTSPQ